MSKDRNNKLAGQIGEFLVCAELGRRGLIATPFSGNVPAFDILTADELCHTVPIQVKASRSDNWPGDARKWMQITFDPETKAQTSRGAVALDTRDDFQTLFESLFGQPVKVSVAAKIKEAESIRDKVMHGCEPTEANMRQAIVDVLDYAKEYNDFVKSLASFPPFGDLRGFHGRGERLSRTTTRLVLKGLGFKLS